MAERPARVLLLAHPAGHSLSPPMQNAAFAAAGVAAEYRALDVPPAGLAAAVARLRAEPYLGANVTVPHKEAALRLVDELTPTARAVGAVNTIVRRGSRLVGHNTDGDGFLRGLAESGLTESGLAESRLAGSGLAAVDLAGAGREPSGATCLVLGAGGSARAVVNALLMAGADVHVINRDARRALALVAELTAGRAAAPVTGPVAGAAAPAAGGRAHVGAVTPALLARTDLLVNCTSVGMSGGPDPQGVPHLRPEDLAALPARARVVDLVYRPALTPLLAAARERGLACQNGLPMLVWQGALAFQAWTGLTAPVAVMREAAERGLADTPA